MPEIIAMVTGHRQVPDRAAVLARLMYIIEVLSRRWTVTGISGGAAGADSLWALACHNMQRPFKLYLPNRYYFDHYRSEGEFLNEEASWLLDHCDGDVHYSVDRPERNDWEAFMRREGWKDNFVRNRDMIADAQRHIAVATQHPATYVANRNIRGGTASCIRDLWAGGHEILWIDPNNPEGVRKITPPRR
jgi:hypothetical protein